MANDDSTYENSKTQPVSTSIDGKTFSPAVPVVQQNDTLAEHIAQVAPTLITPVTCESSQVATEKDGGGGQVGVAQSGAKVTPVEVGSDTTGK